MNIPRFNPNDLKVDVNTIGAVLGILAVFAAIIGGVVGSGALNDQSGSSRGGTMRVIETPVEAKPPASTNETEPVEDYLSPALRENSEYFESLAKQADEAIRRQEELLRRSQEYTRQAEEAVGQADEMIRQRQAAGLY